MTHLWLSRHSTHCSVNVRGLRNYIRRYSSREGKELAPALYWGHLKGTFFALERLTLLYLEFGIQKRRRICSEREGSACPTSTWITVDILVFASLSFTFAEYYTHCCPVIFNHVVCIQYTQHCQPFPNAYYHWLRSMSSCCDCGMLTSLIVTVRWLAEGNNKEHIARGAQVSIQSRVSNDMGEESDDCRSGWHKKK